MFFQMWGVTGLDFLFLTFEILKWSAATIVASMLILMNFFLGKTMPHATWLFGLWPKMSMVVGSIALDIKSAICMSNASNCTLGQLQAMIYLRVNLWVSWKNKVHDSESYMVSRLLHNVWLLSHHIQITWKLIHITIFVDWRLWKVWKLALQYCECGEHW